MGRAGSPLARDAGAPIRPHVLQAHVGVATSNRRVRRLGVVNKHGCQAPPVCCSFRPPRLCGDGPTRRRRTRVTSPPSPHPWRSPATAGARPHRGPGLAWCALACFWSHACLSPPQSQASVRSLGLLSPTLQAFRSGVTEAPPCDRRRTVGFGLQSKQGGAADHTHKRVCPSPRAQGLCCGASPSCGSPPCPLAR